MHRRSSTQGGASLERLRRQDAQRRQQRQTTSCGQTPLRRSSSGGRRGGGRTPDYSRRGSSPPVSPVVTSPRMSTAFPRDPLSSSLLYRCVQTTFGRRPTASLGAIPDQRVNGFSVEGFATLNFFCWKSTTMLHNKIDMHAASFCASQLLHPDDFALRFDGARVFLITSISRHFVQRKLLSLELQCTGEFRSLLCSGTAAAAAAGSTVR